MGLLKISLFIKLIKSCSHMEIRWHAFKLKIVIFDTLVDHV